mmetsp:Transcript_75739/g.245151  ORF Transcript_75739/g.245151 Transcript_75739/m.245151 type:complete len:211 (-) Transcript_75739:53-685(-)
MAANCLICGSGCSTASRLLTDLLAPRRPLVLAVGVTIGSLNACWPPPWLTEAGSCTGCGPGCSTASRPTDLLARRPLVLAGGVTIGSPTAFWPPPWLLEAGSCTGGLKPGGSEVGKSWDVLRRGSAPLLARSEALACSNELESDLPARIVELCWLKRLGLSGCTGRLLEASDWGRFSVRDATHCGPLGPDLTGWTWTSSSVPLTIAGKTP